MQCGAVGGLGEGDTAVEDCIARVEEGIDAGGGLVFVAGDGVVGEGEIIRWRCAGGSCKSGQDDYERQGGQSGSDGIGNGRYDGGDCCGGKGGAKVGARTMM